MTSQCQTQYTNAYGNDYLAIVQNSFQNVGRIEHCIEVFETVIVMHSTTNGSSSTEKHN